MGSVLGEDWVKLADHQVAGCDSADGGEEGDMDDDYASAGSGADDEATLEEEAALAAQDGIDQKVHCSCSCRQMIASGVAFLGSCCRQCMQCRCSTFSNLSSCSCFL